jgi:predicted dehydrogenase
MMERRDFLQQFGGIVLSGAVVPGVTLADEKPAPKRIKIGQIGVGHAHAGKLAVYRTSPDYEVVGIVEPDAQLRKQAENASPYHGLKWLTLDQLLDTPGLLAVLVETRVRDLLDNAKACVAASMHVHIDKPAGASLSFGSPIPKMVE